MSNQRQQRGRLDDDAEDSMYHDTTADDPNTVSAQQQLSVSGARNMQPVRGSRDVSSILKTKVPTPAPTGGPPASEATSAPQDAAGAGSSTTGGDVFFSSIRTGRRGDAVGGGQPVVIVEPEGYDNDDRFYASRSKRPLPNRKPGGGGAGGAPDAAPQSSQQEWAMGVPRPGDANMTLDDPTSLSGNPNVDGGTANTGGGGAEISTPVKPVISFAYPGSSREGEDDDVDAMMRSVPFEVPRKKDGLEEVGNPLYFNPDFPMRHSVGGVNLQGIDGPGSPLDMGGTGPFDSGKGIVMGVVRQPAGANGNGYGNVGNVGYDGMYRPVGRSSDSTVPSSRCCGCLFNCFTCCGCTMPRDPRSIFCIGAFLLFLVSLVAPVLCAVSLFPAFHYTNSTVPSAVTDYLDWHEVVYFLDDLEDSILLFSYFGERLPPMITVSESDRPAMQAAWNKAAADPQTTYDQSRPRFLLGYSVDKTVNLLDRIAHDLEVSHDSSTVDKAAQLDDIALIQSKLVNFKSGVLLQHVNTAMEHRNIMTQWDDDRWMRDVIGNTFYTTAAATATARTFSLLQLSKMSCYRLLACWGDADTGGAKETLERIELLAGAVSGTASNVLNEIFNVIADPRGKAETLDQLMQNYVKYTKARNVLLAKAEEWFGELKKELEPYRDSLQGSGITSTPNKKLAFAIHKYWADQLHDTVKGTLDMVKDVQTLFESNSPFADWLLTGATDILSASAAEHELLYAATAYKSIFSHKVGESLELSFTEEEANDYLEEFNKADLKGFFDDIRPLILKRKEAASANLFRVAKMSLSDTVNTIHTAAMTGLLLGIFLPLIPFFFLACCLRYRIQRSALPFSSLLLILFVCYLMVAISAVVFYLEACNAPLRDRTFTEPFLVTVANTLESLLSASASMSTSLHLSFMVAGSIKSAEEALIANDLMHEKFRKQFEKNELALAKAGAPGILKGNWLAPMEVFCEITAKIFEGGFNPLRHQYTCSITTELTTSSLNSAFHMPSLDDAALATEDANDDEEALRAINPPGKSCWAAMSGAASNALSATFLSIVSVEESLVATSISLKELDRSNIYTRASLESSCVASRLAASINPSSDRECYVASVCTAPSSLGMLRTVESGRTVLNIFDPSKENRLGPLLLAWQRTVVDEIPVETDNLLRLMESSARNDARVVSRGRRFIVWGGVFVCLTLQFVCLVTYNALFGESYFGSFLS